jgi:hypothetical protein
MKKPAPDIVLALGKPGEEDDDEDHGEEQDLDAIKKDAAEELLEAFRANDASRVLDALDTVIDACLHAKDEPEREEEEDDDEEGGEEDEL